MPFGAPGQGTVSEEGSPLAHGGRSGSIGGRKAHYYGHAVVVVCPLELAEMYQERLQGHRLTATIEKV